jgi:hypothetical protein
MSEGMKLSTDEIRLIKLERSKKNICIQKERFYRSVLHVANEFLKWQKTEGMGLTYSTFIDNFNCMKHIPEEFQHNSKIMYSAVKASLDAAATYANNLTVISGEEV